MTPVEIVLFLVIFIVSLFVMITLHEFGHFVACKRSRIPVEEFSIGMFGPQLVSVKRGETVYAFRPVLIGAFVRPIGENDPDVPNGLAAQGSWVRFKVFAAGPLANIALAYVILSGFFAMETDMSWVEHEGIMIYEVEEGSPAEAAGIEPGDFILSIDGDEIEGVQDIQDALELAGEDSVNLIVGSNEETEEVMVQPEYDSEADRRKMGVTLAGFWGLVSDIDEGSIAAGSIEPGDVIVRVNSETVYDAESFDAALGTSEESGEAKVELYRDEDLTPTQVSLDVTALSTPYTAEAIGIHNKWANGAGIETKHYPSWQGPIRSAAYFISFPSQIVAAVPFIRENPDLAAVGVVGAGQLAVETVSLVGFSSFIFLAALISLGLALFNLIPMPPLDGGGMLVAVIEGLRGGKRMSAQAMQFAYTIGFAVVITLFVLIMYNDIARLIKGESFLG
jgi:regulator of sigma E protease